jgi:Ca-activated chloride channel family protein
MKTNEENFAVLKDVRGREVALKGVNVRARLHGLMADVEVEQIYRNPQKRNIEAIYTFPLPLGAVLLALDVEIGGRKLSGSVVEKKQAERDYEDAVTDGNSAVMLEEAGPGLYTASLGNLMAGESAVIRYRYGLLLSWQGPSLRFLLPTTIAPRYGDAGAAGLQQHQVPTSSLEVDYPLDLSVTVEGELSAATIASPSHPIAVSQSDNGVVVRLTGTPVLDRDFVLTVESQSAQSSCVLTPDREGRVALASLRIPPLALNEEKPLAIKVVIDCSGSMGGTSIAQARKAALELLNLLRPGDSFNVTLFGSKYTHLFRTLVPVSPRYVTEASNRLDGLDADMGGTEMEKALDAVFCMGGSDAAPTILLITDGEIHEHQKLVKRAAASGHRIFTVGVGTAVAETFLKSLARSTQGACELVAPQEGMAERVLEQFHRMRQPKLGELSIDWPEKPEWQTALPEVVFAGDTVHIFAGFGKAIEGNVRITAKGSQDVLAPVSAGEEADVPRIAAARRMDTATDAESLRLALDYQLLSRWTNFLVIAERADKATDLPELHQVPQMLAAGWGGTAARLDLSSVCSSARGRNSQADAMAASGVDRYDIPAFLRRSCDDGISGTASNGKSASPTDLIMSVSEKVMRKLRSPTRSEKLPIPDFLLSESKRRGTPAVFMQAMENELSGRPTTLPDNISELEQWGLDSPAVASLRQWVSEGHAEAQVVMAFLHALSESGAGECFGRAFKRVILKGWKQVAPGQALDQTMKAALKDITSDTWNWMPADHPAEVLP